MKDLMQVKNGTRVYCKEFGIGIVTRANAHAPYTKGSSHYSMILFEGHDRPNRAHRNTFFVRGDRVQGIGRNGEVWYNNQIFTFYAHLDHNPESKKTYTMLAENGYCHYEYDIQHYEKLKSIVFPEEQKLLNKVIDKTLINHPITPIDITRTVFRAGQLSDIGVKADKVLKDKVYKEVYSQPDLDFSDPEKAELLKRIEILELQAKIRELES